MKTIVVALAALIAVGSIAVAQQKAPAKTTALAKKVAVANAFAIKSSELAAEQSQSSDVKSFAQQMIAYHTKAGQEFQSALQAAKIPPPPRQELNAKQKAALSKLRALRGAAFDKAYLSGQLKGHKEAVSLFRSYAKSGRTPELKQFAERMLPTLERHMQMAQDLSSQGVAGGRPGSKAGSRAIGPPAQAPQKGNR
jgi:putative membrane protein